MLGEDGRVSLPVSPAPLPLVPQDNSHHQPVCKERPDNASPQGEGGVAVTLGRSRHSSFMGWYLLLHFS